MSTSCKHCGAEECVKYGKVNGGHQRYRCKSCKRSFTVTRRKYSLDFKLKVIRMYLEGIGLRSIARLEGVSNVLVLYWIRTVGSLIRQKLDALKRNPPLQEIEIIEIDELHSYCKKNATLCGYGLPLIVIGTKLLILK